MENVLSNLMIVLDFIFVVILVNVEIVIVVFLINLTNKIIKEFLKNGNVKLLITFF